MPLTKKYLYVLLSLFCLISPVVVKAQELIKMTVVSGESFFVHPDANVSVFSDITNSGSIGSHRNSTINFLGQRWISGAGSRIVDESSGGANGIGGAIRFAGSGMPQYINTQLNISANTGFPNISIVNSSNVILEGLDLVVRNNLTFESGRVILNNRNVNMRLNSTISGYNQNRYFVTGAGVSGGSLIRKSTGLQQDPLVFPVGTSASSYTPVSVNYSGVAQDIKVRVFDNVYDKATFGISDNQNYVTKTWNVNVSSLDPRSTMTVHIQHNGSEEGSQFAANKNSRAYISRYSSSIEKWDIISSSILTPGIISSVGAVPNAYVSTRSVTSGLTQNEYFSKSVVSDNVLSNYRVPAGISPNNDGLNDKFVIENLKSTDKVGIEIYNRWQSLVYKDPNYRNTFDGIGNQKGLINNELPDGTYYYILNFNSSKPVTGYIVINR